MMFESGQLLGISFFGAGYHEIKCLCFNCRRDIFYVVDRYKIRMSSCLAQHLGLSLGFSPISHVGLTESYLLQSPRILPSEALFPIEISSNVAALIYAALPRRVRVCNGDGSAKV